MKDEEEKNDNKKICYIMSDYALKSENKNQRNKIYKQVIKSVHSRTEE